MPDEPTYFWLRAEAASPPEGPVAVVVRNFDGVTVNFHVRLSMPRSLSSTVIVTS